MSPLHSLFATPVRMIQLQHVAQPLAPLHSTSLLIDAVSAWSVSGETLTSTDAAASLFGASLFPYLTLLYFLSRPETRTPKLGNFGFQFLLAFVFATIPAGIYAKVQYHDILANVDWLHGSAESLLTLTNLFIIFGFRAVRDKPTAESFTSPASTTLNSSVLAGVAALVLAGLVQFHPEPANALSIPTWVVHASSLLEWLVAMKLIYEHSEIADNPRWKGLTWGMVPSHASGLCACTFHLFYNAAALNWLVFLQSLLTLVGNSTMALAAWRIYAYEKQRGEAPPAAAAAPLPESDTKFLLEMLAKSLAISFAVKYGELAFDFPFEASTNSLLAGALIGLPTLANVAKWKIRSDAAAATLENEAKGSI